VAVLVAGASTAIGVDVAVGGCDNVGRALASGVWVGASPSDKITVGSTSTGSVAATVWAELGVGVAVCTSKFSGGRSAGMAVAAPPKPQASESSASPASSFVFLYLQWSVGSI
jgi:hypothetical protein